MPGWTNSFGEDKIFGEFSFIEAEKTYEIWNDQMFLYLARSAKQTGKNNRRVKKLEHTPSDKNQI